MRQARRRSPSGSPTRAGQADTQALSILINSATPPNITTTTLPGGTVSQPYSQGLQATGGTGTLVWSRSAGSLPANLSLSSAGTIAGTPTNTGTSNFTVMVTDALSQSDTQPLSITISAAPAPLTITTTTLPGGTVGLAYNQTLQATGGTGTRVWSLSVGSLPANLSLSSAGVISGTPTNTGTSNFTVRVTDALSQSDTQPLSIMISPATPPLTITTDELLEGRRNRAYTDTLEASGGTKPYTWSVTPALPAGLTLAPATGVISGTPTAPSNINHNFTVRDSSQSDIHKAAQPSNQKLVATAPSNKHSDWSSFPLTTD